MTKWAWGEVLAAASMLVSKPHTARRLSNLSMVAAAVHASARGRNGTRAWNDGAALKAMLPRLSLHPLPQLGDDKGAWDRLAAAAERAAPVVSATVEIELWVEEWQSASDGRKVHGAYATPAALADQLAYLTLKPLARRKEVRVVDPSVGAGSLLLSALRVLAGRGSPARRRAVALQLYGADLDPDARELCCHLLWLVAGAAPDDLPLIAANIVVADALSFDWWSDKARAPFDALIMNPPWESLRQALPDGHHSAAARKAIADRLSEQRLGAPDLPPLFTAQGRGDKNLFKAFVELAPHLLRDDGRLGALVPAALASDAGMAPLRRRYFEHMALERWSVIENVEEMFPIDSRYKFGVLIGARSKTGTQEFGVRGMCSTLEELSAEHVTVQRWHLETLGGALGMIPEVRTKRELEILSCVATSGAPFFSGGCLGGVRYTREVDLTIDRAKGRFTHWDHAHRQKRWPGSRGRCSDAELVPLVEGRMVTRYDFFEKSWLVGSGRTARWEVNGNRPLHSCRPQFVIPRRTEGGGARVAICDVTSATNTRTVHATLVPDDWWCGNTAPVLMFRDRQAALAGMAVLNSMVFDWIARRLVSGLHLNKFYLEAMWWPRLTDADVQGVACAALTLVSANPRFRAAGFEANTNRSDKPHDLVGAHIVIEQTVARGFGLTRSMVETMLDEDHCDRRGLWRFFAAEPWALDVKQRVIDILGSDCRRVALCG